METGTIIAAGVDWLTCSGRTDGSAKELQRQAERHLLSEQLAGCDLKESSFEGYRMISCGSVGAGWREDGVILRLSSHMAKEHWRAAVSVADNVSRLDLQATIKYDPPESDLPSKLERRALAYKKQHNLRTQIELRRNDVKGSTLYTGQRTSYRFGRVYDKYRESGHDYYKGCYRAEVELKKREAVYMAGQLYKSPAGKLMDVDYVLRYYRRLGLLVAKFDPKLTVGYEPRPKVDRSLQQILAWYKRGVQPSVKLTVNCAGLDVVLEALGLLGTVREQYGALTPKEEK